MNRYLLIESRDPFESRDSERYVGWAAALARAGHDVHLFLVQDAVLAARRRASFAALAVAAAAGVGISADDFSLRERGIADADLLPSVRPAPLDLVVERLAAGCKALWH
jgi:sulfur relay (sulfurtransferase) complex TusBCD TusD component (DsrE family)